MSIRDRVRREAEIMETRLHREREAGVFGSTDGREGIGC